MTIKELLLKLENNTATQEDRDLLSSKQNKIFSSLSAGTIREFQDAYELVPMEKRSWEDFNKRQQEVLAECIRCEFLIPEHIRTEFNLAPISEDTVLEDISS